MPKNLTWWDNDSFGIIIKDHKLSVSQWALVHLDDQITGIHTSDILKKSGIVRQMADFFTKSDPLESYERKDNQDFKLRLQEIEKELLDANKKH